MNDFEFTLKFALPNPADDANSYIDALFENGCDDALLGTGVKGRIALDFNRSAKDAITAVMTAIHDVQTAIPGARLIEASPDQAGVTDIANVVGVSRQYIRKVAYTEPGFPLPFHEGKQALWHLYHVLEWFRANQKYDYEPALFEVSRATMKINIGREDLSFTNGANETSEQRSTLA